MGMNSIKVSGGSDDLIYLEIKVGGKTVFDDELGNHSRTFDVNGHFTIHLHHGLITGTGWLIGIDVEEDALTPGQFRDAYDIRLFMAENGYSPELYVETDENIVIKGVYGDKSAKAREALEKSNRLDYSDIDEVIKILEKNELLK